METVIARQGSRSITRFIRWRVTELAVALASVMAPRPQACGGRRGPHGVIPSRHMHGRFRIAAVLRKIFGLHARNAFTTRAGGQAHCLIEQDDEGEKQYGE